MTPFFEALSIVDWAAFSFTIVFLSAESPIEFLTSLTIPLILVLVDLLRSRLNSFWRARFNADL